MTSYFRTRAVCVYWFVWGSGALTMPCLCNLVQHIVSISLPKTKNYSTLKSPETWHWRVLTGKVPFKHHPPNSVVLSRWKICSDKQFFSTFRLSQVSKTKAKSKQPTNQQPNSLQLPSGQPLQAKHSLTHYGVTNDALTAETIRTDGEFNITVKSNPFPQHSSQIHFSVSHDPGAEKGHSSAWSLNLVVRDLPHQTQLFSRLH